MFVQLVNYLFSKRCVKVIAELKASSADIICLQEVDHFDEFYKDELAKLDYDVYYNQKIEKCKEGLVIGLKKDKVEAVGNIEIVNYDNLKPRHPAHRFNIGYIGQILLCKVKGTDNYFLIGNTYLIAILEEDFRVGSASMFIHRLGERKELLKDKKVGTILCGDLNCLPGSTTFCRIYNLPIDLSEQENIVIENIKGFEQDFTHKLTLESAYSKYRKSPKGAKGVEKLAWDIQSTQIL